MTTRSGRRRTASCDELKVPLADKAREGFVRLSKRNRASDGIEARQSCHREDARLIDQPPQLISQAMWRKHESAICLRPLCYLQKASPAL